MSLFSQQQPESKIALIFDVGSATVAGALVLLREDREPVVLYHTRETMTFHREVTSAGLVSSMREALRNVMRHLGHEALPHLAASGEVLRLDAVFVSYASPWYRTRTKVITTKHSEPFTFTPTLVDSVIEKDMLAHGDEEIIIERALTRAKLDGTTTDNPYGKKARSAELSFLVALMPRHLYEIVSEELERLVGPMPILHHSFMLTAYSGVIDLMPHAGDFLLVDISGEVTDIALVRGDDGIVATATFPVGSLYLVREVVNAFDMTIEEAASLLRLAAEGGVSSRKEHRVRSVLERVGAHWADDFVGALVDLNGEPEIPHRVFLTSGKTTLPFFAGFLEGDYNAQALRKGIRFAATPLGSEELAAHVSFSGEVVDPFLALEALFLHKRLFL